MSSPKPNLDDLRIERTASPESPSKKWLIIGGGVVAVFLIAAIAWLIQPGGVSVHTAVAREITAGGGERTVLNASGYVTARRQATVSSKVTGKVVEVLVEEGMKVKEGQVLARLDDTNVKTSLRVAEAQLESAKTALEETRALLKDADLAWHRTIDLRKENIASQADLDTAESNAKSLQARLDRQQVDITVAQRQVELWQQQMEDTIIRAPFDGIVTSKDAQPGEMVSPVSAGGGFTRTGICTIVDMSSLEIEIDVNESYINRVEPGQPVEATLDAYPEWKIPCKVIAIIPTADRDKSTVKVRVGFDKLDPRILPEMSVKVAFRDTGTTAADRSVIIPKSSVESHDGHDVIYVVHNHRAERRAVTVGSTQNNDAVVLAGVSDGETVIVDPPPGLADGTAVKNQ
ncbi:MAG TPA: efflux RND transporter periplasmic adaptor subunit [Verrucomicrobiae bacterium]|nr:efflux RND transporter periplasmic adaptor subunit [Verrucomicrobiae bacterium]